MTESKQNYDMYKTNAYQSIDKVMKFGYISLVVFLLYLVMFIVLICVDSKPWLIALSLMALSKTYKPSNINVKNIVVITFSIFTSLLFITTFVVT